MDLDGKCIPHKGESLAGKYWACLRNGSKAVKMGEGKENRDVLGNKVCCVHIRFGL